jgi:chromosome segregation ATPase
MKLFYTNSSAKEEIGNLETRIAALEADNTASAADIARLTEEAKTATESLAAMTTERDEAISAFEAAEKTATEVTVKLATANETLATFDAKVETAAQAKFESLGGPPIPANGNEEKENSAMTRAAFSTLDHNARNAYIKNGGKLKD